MNRESESPAVCDIVAAGPFGKEVLESCKRNGRIPQIIGNGDIAFLQDRGANAFHFSMLATQRRDPNRIDLKNHAKQLIGGYFDGDDVNAGPRYYYRSILARAWGKKLVEEKVNVIQRIYENARRGVAARGTSETVEDTTATPPDRQISRSSMEDSSPTDVAEPQISGSALLALIRTAIAEELRRTN